MASSDSSLRFRYNEVSRVPLLNFPDTRSPYAPRGRLRVASRSPSATCPPLRSGAFRFDHPSRFDGLLLASWCLNTGHAEISIITRLYEGDSLALSLIRSSGETRAHRSPSARPAFLTVRRLLYSNDSFHSFSSAEFCSAYPTLADPNDTSKMSGLPVHLSSAAQGRRTLSEVSRIPSPLNWDLPSFTARRSSACSSESMTGFSASPTNTVVLPSLQTMARRTLPPE